MVQSLPPHEHVVRVLHSFRDDPIALPGWSELHTQWLAPTATVKQLKDKLRDANLPVSGLKAVLVQRLLDTTLSAFGEVNLAFFNDGKRVKGSNWRNKHMCADPLTAAASASCCNDPDGSGQPAMSMCRHEALSSLARDAGSRTP